MIRIEQTHTLTDPEQSSVIAPLDTHSRALGHVWDPKPLNLILREEDAIVGGLLAETQLGWMYVSALSVAEHLRGQGHGRALMEAAEVEAVARGCHSAWLNTFSYQAPEFYRRLGYVAFGTLDDYPPGETRIFLQKKLFAGARS